MVDVEPRVALVVEEVADRMPDRGLLQEARRDLVQERLEGVVVVLVDEHDVDVGLLQLLGRADPAKAASEDEDARPRLVRSLAHVRSRYGRRAPRAHPKGMKR